MHTQLADLQTILRREIDQYRQLLALVRQERARIVRRELAALAESVQRKEAVTRELAQIEASRTALLARLAAEFREEGSAMTLARAAALAPGDAGAALRALLAEFREVVGLLMAANDVNRTLLDRSLEVVQGSLQLFHTVTAAPPTYGAGGRFQETAHPLAVVNQTA